MTAQWLAFTPAYTAPRSAMPRVGAHAFAEGADLSLCGCVPRAKAGGPASLDARQCVPCIRREITRRLAIPTGEPRIAETVRQRDVGAEMIARLAAKVVAGAQARIALFRGRDVDELVEHGRLGAVTVGEIVAHYEAMVVRWGGELEQAKRKKRLRRVR